MMARFAQMHVESKHWSVNMDAMVVERRLGQGPVRDVHASQAVGKRKLVIDVIVHTCVQGIRPMKKRVAFMRLRGRKSNVISYSEPTDWEPVRSMTRRSESEDLEKV
jgi:hypothetical protein